MRLAVALLAPAILVGACSMADDADPEGAPPDLVVHGGPVLTMDDASTVADAVAVANGKVVAVGTAEEVLALADQDTRIVDVGGRTVMPGIVEPHTHLLQGVAPERQAGGPGPSARRRHHHGRHADGAAGPAASLRSAGRGRRARRPHRALPVVERQLR